MENKTQVRIGVNKDGIFIQAGDPENKEIDIEYMDIVREGGMVKSICFLEYKKLKLYDPYPSVKDVEGKMMDFGGYILGEIWHKRLVSKPDCWYHNGKKVSIVNLQKYFIKAAQSSLIEDKTQAVKAVEPCERCHKNPKHENSIYCIECLYERKMTGY